MGFSSKDTSSTTKISFLFILFSIADSSISSITKEDIVLTILSPKILLSKENIVKSLSFITSLIPIFFFSKVENTNISSIKLIIGEILSL